MDFPGLLAALAHHQQWEGEAVQVRDENGVWWDVVDIIRPLAEGWAEVGTLANADALDDTEIKEPSGFIAGRSSMAHTILRAMARAEGKAVDQ